MAAIRVSAFETWHVRSDCVCSTPVFPHPVIKLRRLAAVARGVSARCALPMTQLEAAAAAVAEPVKATVAPAAWVDWETDMTVGNAAWSGEEAAAAAAEAGEAAVAPAAWVACAASMPAGDAAWPGKDSAAAADAGKAAARLAAWEAWAASMPEAAASSEQAVVGGAAGAIEDNGAAMAARVAGVEAGKAAVALAAWVAWAASMPEASTFAGQSALETAAGAAAVGGAANAAPHHQPAVIAKGSLALAAFKVWSVWAADAARDAAVAEADRAAGEAVIDADGSIWDDYSHDGYHYYYDYIRDSSGLFIRRERTRMGLRPG